MWNYDMRCIKYILEEPKSFIFGLDKNYYT